MSTLMAAAPLELGWQHRAADGRVFRLRRCRSAAELDSCVALQQQVWGYADAEVVPRNIYVLAQALGGHVIGAWDAEDGLAGFAMAMAAHAPSPERAGREWWMQAADGPGLRAAPEGPSRVGDGGSPPTPYLHSHMLAVRETYQDCGLGFALKRAQREDALARGIGRMRWTFDPLMSKNAFFNLQRLGATATLYIENFYGKLHSQLQGGLPSDRLVADWPLASKRVEAALARQPVPTPRIVARVELPAAVATLKAEGRLEEAGAVQSTLRIALQQAFGQGLVAVGFVPTRQGGGTYMLAEDAPDAALGKAARA